MSLIHGKIWGSSESIFSNGNVEINYINTKEGGYCSEHRHCCKYNMFYVLEGELKIEVWKIDYKLTDVTILKAGQKTTVSPGEFHKFTAMKDTKALEIYWVELHLDDIERKKCGGIPVEKGN